MESKVIIYDCEVFAYDFLVVFEDVVTNEVNVIVNDGIAIEKFLYEHSDYILCGFNNKNYDKYILAAMINTDDPIEVKAVNDYIIENHVGWTYPNREVIRFNFPQFDLMDDMQAGLSLKSIEGHLGWNIEESKIDFTINRKLTPEEIEETIEYCKYDVKATRKIFELRQDYLNTKIHVGALAGLDEKTSLAMTNAKLTAKFLKAKPSNYSDERDYQYPTNLKREYIPEKVFEFFDRLKDKSISDEDVFDTKLKLVLGGCPTTIGFGGIHGSIPNYIESATDDRVIENDDVASYYPHLMTINGYTSRSMPNPKQYEDMLEERMQAKKSGDKKKANALKLVANTTYGATLNSYNDLYDPLKARSVCISGQLYLTELSNHLVQECENLKIIQLNTDGVMFSYDKRNEEKVREITKEWQERTGFELEVDHIKKIIQKDVSNYIEIATTETLKIKGGLLVKGLAKAGAFNINNNLLIVSKAIIDYLVDLVPVEKTIWKCDDITQFQIIAKASSKYSKVFHERDGKQVAAQRCNRVYASKDENLGTLYKIKKENGQIAKIESLPEHCVIDNDNHLTINDINKDWYINLAMRYVNDFLGNNKKPTRKEKTISKLEQDILSILK